MNRHPANSLSPATPRIHWIRRHGFLLGLLGAVVLAFMFPSPGARGGMLHAEFVNNAGIALILFLQGLSLALEKLRRGVGNWRLHVLIQLFTFAVFPAVGFAMNAALPAVWAGEPEAIRAGLLYLCVLPSTVSTSVVLTAVAGGNTAGALFNAALSNIAGVLLTPILVHLLMQTTGQHGSFGPLLLQIMLLTLLPFAAGMVLRHWLHRWVDAHKAWATWLSNAVILFIVYAAFCDSVHARVWDRYGLLLTAQVLALAVGLFALISGLLFGANRLLRLNRADAIAGYFCGVKKTLAMGVPLAALIFGPRADLSLIMLPLMLYHPLQLFVNGLLANRWARKSCVPEASKTRER